MAHPGRNRSVTLREVRDADGTRVLTASQQGDGAIVIEGLDLGPGVEAAWGPGFTEYEWGWTIRPEDVPAALAALEASASDDPLQVLRDWYARHDRDPGQALRDSGVTIEFWNWVGE